MSRPKQKPNEKSSKALKTLCEELDITQTRLSEITGISQNTLSRIRNGKIALTRPIAEEIVKAFPGYRIGWLLGYEDDAHESQQLHFSGVETIYKYVGAAELLCKLGIKLGSVFGEAGFLPVTETNGFLSENVEARIGDETIWKGEEAEIETALLEICDFSLFKIEQLCKRKER